MPLPHRIAVLECDTPLEQTKTKYGGYGGVFTTLLYAGAQELGMAKEDVQISVHHVVDDEGEGKAKREINYPDLRNIDAVLITGSRFNAFDDSPWILELVKFVKQILAQDRVRIIGVCFGHQIVGRAMGAKVSRSEGGVWEVSVCDVDLTEKGRELFGGKQILKIFQMHKDIVHTHPPTTIPLGSSPACAVQGMYIPRRLITIQGHPEFNREIVTELLLARKEQGIFDEGVFADAMGRVGRGQDGVVVAGAFLRFLGE